MGHDEPARLPEHLIPDVVRRAERRAVVTGRRLNVDLLKGVRSRILPLATLFMAQPPARHSRGSSGRAGGRSGRGIPLLEHHLQRGGHGLVARRHRLIGRLAGPSIAARAWP